MLLEKIKKLAEEKGVTIDEIEEELNLCKGVISKYSITPGIDFLKDLSIYFNVSINFLIGIPEFAGREIAKQTVSDFVIRQMFKVPKDKRTIYFTELVSWVSRNMKSDFVEEINEQNNSSCKISIDNNRFLKLKDRKIDKIIFYCGDTEILEGYTVIISNEDDSKTNFTLLRKVKSVMTTKTETGLIEGYCVLTLE